MPTKPGGIAPRTQGLRSGSYLWSAGRSVRHQIFPTVFQEKSSPDVPSRSVCHPNNRRRIKDAQDGLPGQESHPRTGLPHANQARRHYSPNAGTALGVLFMGGGPIRPLSDFSYSISGKGRMFRTVQSVILKTVANQGCPGRDTGAGASSMEWNSTSQPNPATLPPNAGSATGGFLL